MQECCICSYVKLITKAMHTFKPKNMVNNNSKINEFKTDWERIYFFLHNVPRTRNESLLQKHKTLDKSYVNKRPKATHIYPQIRYAKSQKTRY